MSDLLLQLVGAALAAAGVAAFCLGVGATLRRMSLDQRLREHVAPELRPLRAAARPAEPRLRAGTKGEQLAAWMNRRLSRSALGAAVQLRLVRAGLAWKPSQLILLQSAAGLVAGLF